MGRRDSALPPKLRFSENLHSKAYKAATLGSSPKSLKAESNANNLLAPNAGSLNRGFLHILSSTILYYITILKIFQ